MNIKLEQLTYEDADDLLELELNNRAFFESMVPSRGDDFYNLESFKKQLQVLLDEQSKGLSYFNLIKNENGQILGRMNVVDINQTNRIGHIGYRVGQSYTGYGVAYKALKLLIEEISQNEIKQLLAKTTNHNIASQKVLEKNGFEHYKTDDDEFTMHGEKVRFVYYKLDLHGGL